MSDQGTTVTVRRPGRRAPVDKDKLRLARENAGMAPADLANELQSITQRDYDQGQGSARLVQAAERGECGVSPKIARAWAEATLPKVKGATTLDGDPLPAGRGRLEAWFRSLLLPEDKRQ